MPKVTLALGSFIVGVCSMLLVVPLSHTSTRVQAQSNPAVLIVGAEPDVPPIGGHFIRSVLAGDIQPLDGINCDECQISARVLTYAGGVFRCVGCSIFTQEVQLKGAGLNTFNILKAIGAIPSPPAPPEPRILKPQLANTIPINAQKTVTWVSLEGIKK